MLTDSDLIKSVYLSKFLGNISLENNIPIQPFIELQRYFALGLVLTMAVVSYEFQNLEIIKRFMPFVYLFFCGILSIELANLDRRNLFSRVEFTQLFIFLILVCDCVVLTGILFFSSGISNPFIILLFIPHVLGTILLVSNLIAMLSIVVASCFSLLAVFSYPLIGDANSESLSVNLRFSYWISLMILVIILTSVLTKQSKQRRLISTALIQADKSIADYSIIIERATLAAAIAHEISSPLSTITVIAKDLENEIDKYPNLKDDIKLLNSQSNRCKKILSSLTANVDKKIDNQHPEETFEHFLRRISKTYKTIYGKKKIKLKIKSDKRGLTIPSLPELEYSFSNILSNAYSFAKSSIKIKIKFDKNKLSISIKDDGPGINEEVLQNLGKPYLHNRKENSDDLKYHSGMGLFISNLFLNRLGGEMKIFNDDGAVINITLPYPLS